jgi:hypothetical protein
MQIDLYGMTFEGPGVTYYLWSPWRASALEHRLFEGIKALPGIEFEKATDELRVHLTDPKTYKVSIQLVERVLKGWQEEGSEGGNERRSWRWMIESDTDSHGYDHTGEQASIWGFIRLGLDRSSPGSPLVAADPERAEDIDLNGFGIRVWRADEAE